MRGQEIREKLRNGECVYGTHTVSFGNPTTAQLTASLPMDFAFICTEHIPLGREEIGMMCRYFAARGISPIVRIPYPSARWANMAIEAGAEGIVAPYLETTAEIEELVGSVRYRPIKGKFLRDMLDGKRKPLPKMAKYMEQFNRNLYLIIGIESVEAINKLDKLLAYDGVDGVFLGPHDITCSMEIPEEYENPLFVQTVVNVIKKCRAAGKGVGIHVNLSLERNRPFIEAGQNFMLHLSDVTRMTAVMEDEFAWLRSLRGDKYRPAPAASNASVQACLTQTPMRKRTTRKG